MMAGWIRGAAVAGALGLAVAGCGRGGGGQAGSGGDGRTSGDRQGSGGGEAQGQDAYAATSRRGGYASGGYGDDNARPPVPMFHGEPMWSENRAHSAKENAEYHYQRAGQDLGAHTLDDFLTKVHRFGDHPPAGTLSLTRPNGDKLLYDPKANLFAVFTKDGAPRTVFKPNSGMNYWTEQKAREAQGGDYPGRRRYGAGGYGRSDAGSQGSGGGGEAAAGGGSEAN